MTRPPQPPTSMQRRNLLKKAAVVGGVLWTVPAIDSFVSVAAAVSGTTTVDLRKSRTGNNVLDPPLSELCTTSATSTVGRGSVTFVRTEDPATICATITVTSGPPAVGRTVYILQSNPDDGCVSGTVTEVGTWAATPEGGPQTFCAPIVDSATEFVVALQLSGGGGTDGYSSYGVVSLP